MNPNRGVKNIIFGLLYQVLTMLISLIIPRLVLVNLGSEVNGLTHSISSLFTYLSLLEAGVGKATQQALYKPLAENDKAAINRIMAATNRYYYRTGYLYIVGILIFAICYCLFVKTTIPTWVVFTVIILSGASSVLSYFVQGKYRILIETEGKGYILTNMNSVSSICVAVCKILLLVAGFGIIALQGMYLFFAILQMLVIVAYVHRYYKWLNLKVEPNFEAISQRNYVLLHQITGMIFNNTDVLLLTMLADLKTVSVYSMYATFYGIIKNVLNTICYSFSYYMGQVFHTDRKQFARLHDVYELYNMALTFSLMCILSIFILPFMRIYTSGITDINYVDPYVPMLFTAMNLLSNGRASSGLVLDFAQQFAQTKWRAILEAAINLIVSVIGIRLFGIYGALFGTIAALLYRANDMILYASRLMNRSAWITYKRWLVNLILFAVVSFAANRILPEIDSLVHLMIYGLLSCIIIVPVFLIVDSLCERKTASYAWKALHHLVLNKGKVEKTDEK